MEETKIIKEIPIKIAEEEVFRYLGYQKEGTRVPIDIKKTIREEIEQAYSLLENKGIYRFLNIVSISADGVIVTAQGYHFSVNRKRIDLFQKAEYLLCAMVTVGPKIEQTIKERFEQNQYLRAMVLDAVGTVAVKTVGQWLNHFIEEKKNKQGFQLSRYFEPGSNDWDIQEQKKLFVILQPEKIGVTLSSSLMMQPAKSLSWIRAMGQNLVHSYRDEFSCQFCLLTNCPFRKK